MTRRRRPSGSPASAGFASLTASVSGGQTAASEALRGEGGRLLRAAAARSRGMMALLTGLTLARVIASLATPAMLAAAVDAGRDGRGLPAALAGLAAVLAVAALADAGEDLAGSYCGSEMTAWLRHRLVGRVLELGVPGRKRFPSGDVLSRLTESAAAPGAFPVLLLTGTAAALTTVGAIIALVTIDPYLALTLALGLVPAIVLLRVFIVRAGEPFSRYQRCKADIATRMLDARLGIRTIRAGGTTAREVERILEPVPELHEAGRRTWAAQQQVSWRLSLLAPLLQVLVLSIAGVRLAGGSITTGELVAASSYTSLAVASASLFDTLVALLNCQVGAGRVGEVLSTAPAVAAPPRPVPLPDGPGALRLRGVTVRAGDRTVLDRLDLAVPAGAVVAVVGVSGTGKSVLVSTIGRLIDPDEGSVEIDGVPVGAIALPELRRAVVYAFERPTPLGATVHDMIAYSRPGATRAQVREASRAADADGFIRALPEGYGTPLADAPLSGGELQRLGLARAALARVRARVLVIDDATSSLDTATEMRVTQALQRIMAGGTCIVVARRPATAARADLVAWLDAGRIRALAPHADLWPDPEYRKVFASEPAPPQADQVPPPRLG